MISNFMPNTEGLLEGMLKNKIREQLDETAENSDGIEKTAAEIARWFIDDKGKMY